RDRKRSSGRTGAARPETPRTRSERCRPRRSPSRSSRLRSTRGRTGPATPSCHGPIRPACPAWWSGCSGPAIPRGLLFPIQASLLPDVGEGDQQDADEDQHLDKTEPLQLPEQDRPWVEEDGFDVEDDEQHRRRVEADRQPEDGGSGEVAWLRLVFVLAAVLDLDASGKGGVDRAVPVARPVDRLLDQLLVDCALPTAVEGELDALERLRPLLVPLAFDLDFERTQRL